MTRPRPSRGGTMSLFARRRAAVTVVALFALVAAACSDPPTSGGGGEQVQADNGEASLPDCPLQALEDADGPTEITLWYGGIGGPVKDTLESMVAGFNASQDKVELTASD